MALKAVIHSNHAEHQQQHGAAIKAGLERHGIAAKFAPYDAPEPCDFAVCWAFRQSRVIAAAPHVLVMERGHVGDRMVWTSCGWDGLARRGRYPKAPDGSRWERFADLEQPWKTGGDYALVCGQVPGDAALAQNGGVPLNIPAWAQRVSDALRARGYAVRYRPHPRALRNGHNFCPEGAAFSRAKLAEDLADAALAVTFNSTAGVEIALAGVPLITLDAGSMAWPVAAHTLDAPLVRPDRTAWSRDLAWSQWTMDEIANGDAWEALAPLMEESK